MNFLVLFSYLQILFWHKLEIYYYFWCGNTKNWFLDNIVYFKFYSIWYLIFYHLKCGLVIDYILFILIRRGCQSNKTRKEIQLSFKENFITQRRPDSIKDVGDLATEGINCLLAWNSIFSISPLSRTVDDALARDINFTALVWLKKKYNSSNHQKRNSFDIYLSQVKRQMSTIPAPTPVKVEPITAIPFNLFHILSTGM